MIGDDESTRAVVRNLDQANLDGVLRHFRTGGTWGSLQSGNRADYLESVKLGLVALAHEVEAQLARLYQQEEPTDFG